MASLPRPPSSIMLHLGYNKSSSNPQPLNKNTSLKPFAHSQPKPWTTVTSTITTLSNDGFSAPLTLPLTRANSDQQCPLIPKSSGTAHSRSVTVPPRHPFSVHVPSLIVVYMLVLVTESARGIIMPTAWPYFRSFGGTKSALGLFIAAHPFGRILSTFPVGFLSDRYSMKTLMCATCILQVCGHLVYSFAPSLVVIYASRVMLGIGSAATFLSYSHLAKALPSQQRLYHFAYLSGVQFIGVSVVPILGGALSSIPQVDFNFFFSIRLNGYRYPALILALANIIAVICIVRFYKPPRCSSVPPAATNTSLDQVSISSNSAPSFSTKSTSWSAKTNNSGYQAIDRCAPSPPDYYALFACISVNFALRGAIAMLETLAVPLLQQKFQLTLATASICMSMMGVLGAIAYFSISLIPQNLPYRWLLLTGLFLVVIGVFPLSFTFLSHHLSLRFYVTLLSFAWSIGIPLALTTCLALFIKLLNGAAVGSFLALFATAGSLSPLIFGIPVSTIWESFGTEAVFFTILVVTLCSVSFVLVHYRRLCVTADI